MKFYKYELSKYKNKESTKEWTSIYDIGKICDGDKLTINKYLEVEDNYTKAIKIVMKKFSITSLIVMSLEKNYSTNQNPVINDYKSLFNDEFINAIDNVREGVVLEGNCFDKLLKATLREVIWCIFYSDKLHFIIKAGYDFYINITCPKLDDQVISEISDLGLYVREW